MSTPTTPLRLYAPYHRAEALAALSAEGPVRSLCDGQWVVLPDVVLCFAEVGRGPSRSHFSSGSRFVWVAQRPYRVSLDGCPFLPQEVRAGSPLARPIHLLARAAPTGPFRYVGGLAPTDTYGYADAMEAGHAVFELSPVLPPELWHGLGGPAPAEDGGTELEAVFARLGGPASVHTRMRALRDFVEAWHGPLRPGDGYPEEVLRGRALPAPLRAWLRTGGRREGVLQGQNRLLPPEALVPEPDGSLPFYVEAQDVYEWATRGEGEDPPVFGREDASQPWTREGEPLSGFLLQVALFEAIHGAPYGATALDVPPETLARALAPLRPLPLAPWHWPAFPARFLAGDGVLAFTFPTGGGLAELWLGARAPGPLAYLRPLLDERWVRADL